MYVIKEYRTGKKVARSFESETSAIAFMKGCCTNYQGDDWKIGNEAFYDGKRVFVEEYEDVQPQTLDEYLDRDREIIEEFVKKHFGVKE